MPEPTDTSGVLVTAAALAELLDEPDLVVLDASVDLPRPVADGDHRASSGHAAWAAGHIPGSRHLDLLHAFTDPAAPYHFAQPTPARAAAVLGSLGVRPESRLVVYDRQDGFWAARTWWSLRALGLHSRVLDGGLSAWVTAGGRLLATRPDEAAPEPAPAHDPAALGLSARPGAWASRDDVLEIVRGTRDADLVCALGPEQFSGRAPTRYSRRGHIPGSRNLPARGFIRPDGTLLDPGDLADEARAELTGKDRDVVVYCGGGISAGFTALALVLAGYTSVSVYDGSLEEWSADPGLPLAVTPRG